MLPDPRTLTRKPSKARLARMSTAEAAAHHAAQAMKHLKTLNALMRDERSLAAHDELQAIESTIAWWRNFADLHHNDQ